LAQTHAPDEIIIADGGSTDRTVEIARRYSERGVRVVEIGPAYPGPGRNEAIRVSRNDWIALIDAGCVADPRWIEYLASARSKLGKAAGAVFGEYRPLLNSEWDVAQTLAFLGPKDPVTRLSSLSIASSLIHREAWECAGRFPEHLRAAEDLLFFQKLQDHGVAVIRCPEAIVHWQLPPPPGAVFRRFRLYSAHHIDAGLFRTWHVRVMAMDVAAALLIAGAIAGPPVLLVLGAGAAARVLATVARRRSRIGDRSAFRVDRLLRVGFLLLIADAATWAGALDYLLRREPPR
jgi:glycosyltransferase involved in cell wall biosynthesis